ncbi:MAG TPA: hypothetical protein PLV68_21715, partial [Ilumatobacteraceae bacterium]|nr:hypothetical protein [Ilumatobacteraceae bacterium]
QAHPTAIRDHPGMPTGRQLIAEYTAGGGSAVDHLPWFRSLALTKMAASTALIAKHNMRVGLTNTAEKTAVTVAPMLQGALNAL